MIEQLKKQLNREKISLKSVTAMVLFGAIALVFVLFGFQGKHNAIGVGSAARVNQTLISVADFRNESQRMEQMYGQFFAAQGSGDAQRQFVQSQALDNLITTELISQGAEQQGIIVSDEEVVQFIQNEMQVFKKDGRFQKDIYRQILEANRLNPAQFESKIRKDMQNQRARRMFELAGVGLTIEQQKAKALKEKKMNVAFIKINEEVLSTQMKVNEADIQKMLADADFNKKAQAEFQANKSAYSQTEQVRAFHILIKAAEGNADADQKALAKIKEIQTQLSKKDFAQLASQYSEDMGSKINKGDLGFFERGKMMPEFEKAAFELKSGAVSEPVRTAYGYHLIKVTDKKAAIAADFEKSKTVIAKKLIAHEKLNQDLKLIETALKENKSAEADNIIKDLGLVWDETGFTSLEVEMIPKLGSRLATQAAFGLTEARPVLNRVVNDGNEKFILKLKAQKTEPSTEVGTVLAQNGRERASELFSTWIEQLRKKATIEKNQGLVRE